MESSIALMKLDRSELYDMLKSKLSKEDESVQTSTLTLVHESADYCYNKLKAVIRHMPEFTLHDEVHVFNVLHLMGKLIPTATKDILTAPELLLLILTAFFHDIGMAPEENQIRAWKRDWINGGTTEEHDEHDRFKRFCNSFPGRILEIDRLTQVEEHQKAQRITEYLISEYIRETHAERTRQFIAKDWAGKIKYKNTDLTSEVAELCLSHNQDAIKLLEMTTTILCDEHEYACLPFIGVILRLADLLDFDPKRTPSILFSHLSIRNPVSLTEWKKHRAINAWNISPTSIVYSARCKHPAIEASIRSFCDIIDIELRDCSHVLAHISDDVISSKIGFYHIPLPARVNRTRIKPDRDILTGKPLYIYRDTHFTLSKKQVIDLLMGTKLYANTNVALRELIQNSIDACLVRSHMENSWGTDYTPHIVVRYFSDHDQDILEVEDNGIGMNQHIIDSYYSKIGSSYYKSREFYDLLARINGKYDPISRFGIGILSCFMVSDSVDVQTRRLNPDQERDTPLNVVIEGYESIFYIREGKRKKPGTITRLLLRNENPWKRMKHQDFISAVIRSIPNPPFDIDIETDKESITHTSAFFMDINPDSLKKNDWQKDENIKELTIEIDERTYGFRGRAIVGVLEQGGEPVEIIEVLSKTAEVDGESFELSLNLSYDDNEIEKNTTSIDVADDGTINQSNHYSVVAKSHSLFSIHGIAFPDNLFSDYLSRKRQAELRWPFPVLLVLDISAPADLDLNTSRTQIISNRKWQEFEKRLAYVLTREIFKLVNEEYAAKLVKIYSKHKNELFQEGMNQARSEQAL